MNDKPQVTQRIRYDLSLDEYEAFFDLEWEKQITEIARGTELERAVLDLKINWQSISHTHKLPWLCIDFLKRAWKVTFSEDAPAGGFKVKVLKNVQKELFAKVPVLTKVQKPLVQKALKEILEATSAKLTQAQQSFPQDMLWQTLLSPEQREMQLSIWGAQRLCYAALFHSYEEFLRHTIGVLQGKPSLQMPRFDDFDPVPIIGEEIGALIVDEEVTTARLVRNTLAHNGGKITKKLRGRNHGLYVENDIVQIRAHDTRRLFNILKDRALKLAEKAVELLPDGVPQMTMSLPELRTELNEVYEKQLQDLIVNKHIFEHLDEAWKRTAPAGNAIELRDFMWQGYMAFACTAVRRTVDPNPTRSVSLRNFLTHLKSSLGSISRAQYCARYSPRIPERIRNRDYDELTGGTQELTADKIDRDMQALMQAVEPIKGIVDTVIAHTDRTQRTATFNELIEAIEMIEVTYNRYAQLIGCGSTNGLDDVGTLPADIARIWPET